MATEEEGTCPDGYSFIPKAELGDTPQDVIRARVKMWADDGMTFARLTEVEDPDGVWLEVWKTQPQKQAEFKPPYTAELATT